MKRSLGFTTQWLRAATATSGWRWPAALGIWNVIAVGAVTSLALRFVLLREPATGWTIRAVALGLFGLSVLARELVTRGASKRLWVVDAVASLLPLAFVLPLAGSPSEWMAWLLVAVVATMVGRPPEERSRPDPDPRTGVVPEDSWLAPPPRPISTESFQETTFADLAANEADPDDDSNGVAASWSRVETEDGVRLEGQVRVDFAAGERIVGWHVPFVPAFNGLPEFDFELSDDAGTNATAKVTQLRSYGVRLEVRRGGDLDGPAACHVEWVAHRATTNERAA